MRNKRYLFSYINCYGERCYYVLYAKSKPDAINIKPFPSTYEYMVDKDITNSYFISVYGATIFDNRYESI